MRPAVRILFVLVLLGTLAACASGPDSRKRDEALYLYAGAIRWGDIDAAIGFLDPEVLAKKPITPVERARYDQVQFAGYSVKGSGPAGEGELVQIVEIRVINRHTQVERTFTDRQLWKWSKEADGWLLQSGLPDISTR